jgi:hypothetical protein
MNTPSLVEFYHSTEIWLSQCERSDIKKVIRNMKDSVSKSYELYVEILRKILGLPLNKRIF